jgi:1-deoxy-D-xylulose-5-phosphate synthase
LENKSSNVIAVIGDGAISAGMAYEAMNNAGASKTKIIVILNDNDMSIAKPVGAMRTYLAKLLTGKIYFSFRETIKLITSAFSKRFSAKAGKAEDFLRSAFTGGTMFNSLGFYYVGPIDGHDLSTLIPILKNARDSNHEGPIMIHIKTQKGKGYSYAEKLKIIIMEFQNLMLTLANRIKVDLIYPHIQKYLQILLSNMPKKIVKLLE